MNWWSVNIIYLTPTLQVLQYCAADPFFFYFEEQIPGVYFKVFTSWQRSHVAANKIHLYFERGSVAVWPQWKTFLGCLICLQNFDFLTEAWTSIKTTYLLGV